MAFQIIKEPSSAALLGSSLGGGLASGLEALTEGKLKQIAHERREQGFEALGLPKELARYDAPTIHAYLQYRGNMAKIGQQQAAEEQYANRAKKILYGNGGNPGNDNPTGFSGQQEIRPNSGRENQFIPSEPISKALLGPQAMGEDQFRNSDRFSNIQPPQQNMQQQQPIETAPSYQQPEQIDFTGLNQKQINDLSNLTLKKEKLEQGRRKEVRDYLAPYIERSEKAKDTIRNNKLLVQLARKGDIRSGTTHALLNKLGFADFGRNFDTQIAEKTMAALTLDSAGTFGKNAKITNFLEQTFQKTLPTLWNTPQGIEAIATNAIAVAEVKEKEAEITEDIIKKNRGIIPDDINSQREKRLAPYRDNIQKVAVESMARPFLPKKSAIRKEDQGKDFDLNGNIFRMNPKDGQWYLL